MAFARRLEMKTRHETSFSRLGVSHASCPKAGLAGWLGSAAGKARRRSDLPSPAAVSHRGLWGNAELISEAEKQGLGGRGMRALTASSKG